jgi:uncharacterized membrane protein
VHDALAPDAPEVEEYVSVFLPCTPNPTTGFFFYVKRSDVIELDVTPESAASLIMSAGLIQPRSDPQKRLAALAEAARATQTIRTSPPAAPVAPVREVTRP